MDKARIVAIDPYHPQLGLLVPFVLQKLQAAYIGMGDDMGQLLVQFMSSLYSRDLGVILLVALDSQSRVVGYTAATVSTDNGVVMLKPRLEEPTENDAIAEMIQQVKEWGKKLNRNRVYMIAKSYDKKWNEKHGFEVRRYIMESTIRDDA